MLKFTPRRNRAMFIAAANFLAIGVMASIAPAISGYLIKTINDLDSSWGWLSRVNGYHVAFGLSLLFRAGAFPLAGRMVEPTAGPLRAVLQHALSLRSLQVSRWIHRLHEARREPDRVRAAHTLGEFRHPLAVSGLIEALRDPGHAVRDAAADALGKIGSSQASHALIEALFDTKSGIQSPAARALGRIGGVDSLRGLLRYLHTRGTAALHDTVDSLARIGDDAAVLPLVCLFDETDDEGLRMHVARALGRLSRVDSLEEVVDLLHARRPISQQIIR